jgi:hypothetical protein
MMNGYPDPLQGMELMQPWRPQFQPMGDQSLMAAPPRPKGPGLLGGALDGGLLGAAKGLLNDGGFGFGLLGNRGMMTTNGGLGGTNPFTGSGWGSMAPGGQTMFPGGYRAPTDTLNLPY